MHTHTHTQADLCHTYQMLLMQGFSRKRIIVMTYHDAIDKTTGPNIANNVTAKTTKGLYHQSTGSCKGNKRCENALKSVYGLTVHDGVGHLCTDLPIDYTARLSPDPEASVEDKYKDMEKNDLVKARSLQSVLLGDKEYINTMCSARTDTERTKCSGRVLHSTRWDKVLLHLNGHGGSNEMGIPGMR